MFDTFLFTFLPVFFLNVFVLVAVPVFVCLF